MQLTILLDEWEDVPDHHVHQIYRDDERIGSWTGEGAPGPRKLSILKKTCDIISPVVMRSVVFQQWN
jgi:hypothetical protein